MRKTDELNKQAPSFTPFGALPAARLLLDLLMGILRLPYTRSAKSPHHKESTSLVVGTSSLLYSRSIKSPHPTILARSPAWFVRGRTGSFTFGLAEGSNDLDVSSMISKRSRKWEPVYSLQHITSLLLLRK